MRRIGNRRNRFSRKSKLAQEYDLFLNSVSGLIFSAKKDGMKISKGQNYPRVVLHQFRTQGPI